MTSRRDRSLAQNEVAHREQNERAEERVQLYGGGEARFGIVCECDREDCSERLTVTVSEYEDVRADPRLFFVVPGHEDLRIERVTRNNELYLVVRKTGEAGEIAEDADLR